MKTPHTITLIYGDTVGQYNPETSQIEYPATERLKVPCLINFISQARVIRDYGDIKERIMICRFSQEQEPFNSAEYKDKVYKPIDVIDAPIKGSVRLKEVITHGN